jgi:hypothetical protein
MHCIFLEIRGTQLTQIDNVIDNDLNRATVTLYDYFIKKGVQGRWKYGTLGTKKTIMIYANEISRYFIFPTAYKKLLCKKEESRQAIL